MNHLSIDVIHIGVPVFIYFFQIHLGKELLLMCLWCFLGAGGRQGEGVHFRMSQNLWPCRFYLFCNTWFRFMNEHTTCSNSFYIADYFGICSQDLHVNRWEILGDIYNSVCMKLPLHIIHGTEQTILLPKCSENFEVMGPVLPSCVCQCTSSGDLNLLTDSKS